MNRILIGSFFFLSSLCQAMNNGSLFEITASGTPANLQLKLCLDATAQLSCQQFTATGLTLSIKTLVPNHLYPNAGMKILHSNYAQHNANSDYSLNCTQTTNGFCIITLSSTPTTITVFPPLGNTYQGGVLACLNGAPYMNLVAESSDSINGIPWGEFGTTTGAQSTVDGATNSALILQAGATASAVNLCTGTINGYSDWFLPASEQLNCLYQNQNALPGFMNAIYWSSTETDADHALFQFFDNSNVLSVFKTFYNSVRCVRVTSGG